MDRLVLLCCCFAVDVAELPAVAPELSRGPSWRVERHPDGTVGSLRGGFGSGSKMTLTLELGNGRIVHGGSELGPHAGVHHARVHAVHVDHWVAFQFKGRHSLGQQARVRIAQDFGEAVRMAIASCRALIASLAHCFVSVSQFVHELLVEGRGVHQLVSQVLVGDVLRSKNSIIFYFNNLLLCFSSKLDRGGSSEEMRSDLCICKYWFPNLLMAWMILPC